MDKVDHLVHVEIRLLEEYGDAFIQSLFEKIHKFPFDPKF